MKYRRKCLPFINWFYSNISLWAYLTDDLYKLLVSNQSKNMIEIDLHKYETVWYQM